MLKNDPRRFRVLAFTERLAATRIQRHYRAYREYKVERERIRFEQAQKRITKNYARAVIRKYVTIYLLDK